MTEERIRFTVEMTTIGNVGLESMTDDEILETLEDECNIPQDTVVDFEVNP